MDVIHTSRVYELFDLDLYTQPAMYCKIGPFNLDFTGI